MPTELSMALLHSLAQDDCIDMQNVFGHLMPLALALHDTNSINNGS